MSAAFPVFRYANNNWKLQKFASRVYSDWNRDYETDSDNDATPKKRKKSDSNSDSDSDNEKKRHSPTLPPTTPLPPAAPPVELLTAPNTIVGPSPPAINAINTIQPQLVTDPPVPPIEMQPGASHTDHDITPPRNDSPSAPPIISTVSDATVQPTDPTTTTNDSKRSDDVPTNNVDPKTSVAAPQRDRGSRRVTRAAKANDKPNPLSGLSIPKPTTEVPHSEIAPEVRTRSGSKVMEPHPTHLSAKNMFAHEVKKKNPEITQDEFNALFDKLTPNEKKTYEYFTLSPEYPRESLGSLRVFRGIPRDSLGTPYSYSIFVFGLKWL
ncbi:hypothetical protein BJ165DRAFT_1534088 [Panaeolus papilionaceus]|nr:hypothetical protein BJ165DRAFT_1534088 [Panaeolus papilionaceus]